MYNALTSWNNLLLAYKKASAGKRGQANVAIFEYRLEDNLFRLQEELQQKAYRPGPYVNFHIHEPKHRLISAAPFRDRVVHHALCNIIEPIFERSFIFDSYANRVGKGTHRALDRCQEFARRFKYVILFSGEGVLREAYDMVYFPGDDLFAALRPRGLPIGNLTSQFWANVYLNAFDHFVKRELGCLAYLRYVDDLLFFANDKNLLWQWKPLIYFQRKLRALIAAYQAGQIALAAVNASVRGWINHVRYANTIGLRKALLMRKIK